MPKVQMPQLGESVAEGTIGKWLKNVGDHVDKYEPIVEVITDKVNAEVPSPFEGTLTEILVQEGETVPNNTDIAVIDAVGEGAEATGQASEERGAASAEAPAAVATAEATADETASQAGGHGPADSDERPESAPAPAPASAPAQPTAVATAEKGGDNGAGGPDGYQGRMTPAVRRLAREHSIDLSLIQGSGHGGRVTRDDVLKFVEQQRSGAAAPEAQPAQTQAQPSAQPAAPAEAPPAQQPQPAAQQAPAAAGAGPSPVSDEDSLKPVSPMRRAIANQMTKALQVPVAYTTIEVNMAGVVAVRDSLKRQYQEREGISITYDAFVAKATVEALRRHADFNAHYTEEGHWRRKQINLGVAVAVEDGLVVPVIRDADRLSINGLNRQIRELADRARGNRLRMEDVQGGTFTLDNTGWTGSMITQPIINVPEVGILTMESIVKRPVVIETVQGDVIGIRPMMYMCLGFDHRATDGAQAGRFVGDVKRWLESVDANTAVW